MFKKFMTILGWFAVIGTSSYGSYRLGNKLGGSIARRFLKPRLTINEINVWNGPIPEYPGK